MPQKDFISACKCIILSCLLQYNAEHTTSDIILVPFIAVVKFRPPHISRSCKKERELKHHRNFSNPNSTLKITEKVSFNIASEASYVYILRKMPKKVNFKLAVSVTRQVNLNPTEKIEKFKCDILSNFQTLCAEFSVGLNNNKNNF